MGRSEGLGPGGAQNLGRRWRDFPCSALHTPGSMYSEDIREPEEARCAVQGRTVILPKADKTEAQRGKTPSKITQHKRSEQDLNPGLADFDIDR